MSTPEQRVRDFYGFPFPDDFFRLREMLGRLPPDTLREACDMSPALPFAVAEGTPPRDYPDNLSWEGRYYHDLPEFVSLFTGWSSGRHWGYFFDAPGEAPPVVAHYWHSDTFGHCLNGDTLFEALRYRIENDEAEFREMAEEEGEADGCEKRLDQLALLRSELSKLWGAGRKQTAEDYLSRYGGRTPAEPAAMTRDRLGIVVPRGKYRKLSADPFAGPFPDGKCVPHRPQVEELAGDALLALRMGWPGAALKLGRDLWVWAHDYPVCYELLDAAYAALGRESLRRLMAAARGFRDYCDARPAKREPGP